MRTRGALNAALGAALALGAMSAPASAKAVKQPEKVKQQPVLLGRAILPCGESTPTATWSSGSCSTS